MAFYAIAHLLYMIFYRRGINPSRIFIHCRIHYASFIIVKSAYAGRFIVKVPISLAFCVLPKSSQVYQQQLLPFCLDYDDPNDVYIIIRIFLLITVTYYDTK